VRQDLRTSSQAIAAATGHSPVWFRAPYLEINEQVLTIARELGFLHDSSEPERWVQQQILNEFPISINDTGRVLLSDYDFFTAYGLDDMMTLDMLKENYLSRYETGRPFVFLLHPSIIVEHKEVLHQFIAFVKTQGGSCLSFDQYLQRIVAEPSAKSIGVRIDLSLGPLDVKRTISDMVDAQVTDVFIKAQDKTGHIYFDRGLTESDTVAANFKQLTKGMHNAGISVHAWISVLHNSTSAQKNPSQAMVDGRGQPSKNWVSPSHPQNINNIEQLVTDLLSDQSIDGIHLDELAYPALNVDYSPDALKSFKLDTGIAVDNQISASFLPAKHYNAWVTWRSSQLHRIVESVASTAARTNRKVIVSAALQGDSLTNFKNMEVTGQNYHVLAKDLDLIIAVPPDDSAKKSYLSLSRLISMSRFKIGNTPLMIGLPFFAETTTSEKVIEQLTSQLDAVRQGADGFMLSPYRSIFQHDLPDSGRKEHLRDLLTGYSQFLKTTSAPVTPTPIAFIPNAQASNVSLNKSIPPPDKKSIGVQFGTVLVGLFLLGFLGFRFIRSRRFAQKSVPVTAKKDILNWAQLEQGILENRISGQLVHAVAGHLRAYDPVSTSRYRMALVLDLVAKASQQLSLNDLVTMAVDIPGWQVLAMSHLKEAVTHGYLQLDHDRIKVTPKGTLELKSIVDSGFDPAHWIFVEQRMHEILIVSCPNCDEENSAHWYWNNFTCSKCNKELLLVDCTNISRKNQAIVALDQHYYV